MTTQTIERPAARTSADLGALFPGRYLSVTSFKRDGTGVATPVWFVSDGRRLLALTDRQSGKVRRIRHDPILMRRFRVSYRVVMLFYRLGRRLRGETAVADGAALAIEVG
jgi:predicted pyridoxine 5'-phosphate oxidase superfamily flavin-nucleotide-binding protein